MARSAATLLLGAAAVFAAGPLAPLEPGPTTTVAITGGKVYTVAGPPIENATVVIVGRHDLRRRAPTWRCPPGRG